MKKIYFLITFLSIFSASASEGIISNYLKARMPQGSWPGQDENKACRVVVRHDKQVTEDAGRASVFELSIYSNDRQSKSSYKLNDTFIVGGRGDCPIMRTDSLMEIFVVNRPFISPCFSNFNRTNHGGLQVLVQNNVKVFRILNAKDEILSECSINLMR